MSLFSSKHWSSFVQQNKTQTKKMIPAAICQGFGPDEEEAGSLKVITAAGPQFETTLAHGRLALSSLLYLEQSRHSTHFGSMSGLQ